LALYSPSRRRRSTFFWAARSYSRARPGLFFFGGQFFDFVFHVFQFGRHRIERHAQFGGGFVHQVDGFVGQVTVGDVAVGQLGGGFEGSSEKRTL
jgi:hypothetical protein